MAVIANQLLTSGSSSSANSYNTASVSPKAGKLIILCVYSTLADTPNIPTISGNGLTWTQVVTKTNNLGNNRNRITMFRALSSTAPTSGAITIGFSGQNQSRCGWSLTEFSNVVKTGTNGADAIVQSASDTNEAATNFTVTLSAFSKASNATFGFASAGADGLTIGAGTGFTELGEHTIAVSEQTIQAQWRKDNDTTVNWTVANNELWVGVAIEIAESTPGGAFLFNFV